MPGVDEKILVLATDIVAAHVGHNAVPAEGLATLIKEVVQALAGAVQQASGVDRPKPAVPVSHSVSRDSIACLECGKRFRTLKRHLEREHGIDEAEYRDRWQLPQNYRLSAPAYGEIRAAVARKIGLGRQPRGKQRRVAKAG